MVVASVVLTMMWGSRMFGCRGAQTTALVPKGTRFGVPAHDAAHRYGPTSGDAHNDTVTSNEVRTSPVTTGICPLSFSLSRFFDLI
jgi:hypothetical protein